MNDPLPGRKNRRVEVALGVESPPQPRPSPALITGFPVVLDPRVLLEPLVRDVILFAAHLALFRPVWSSQILDEVHHGLLVLQIPAERVQYVVDQLLGAFPEAAEVGGYERIPVSGVPEPKKHVVAAAIRGRAQLIVAEDVSDYPADALSPYRIEAMGVDDFLRDLLDVDPERMVDVLEMLAGCRQLPVPMSVETLLNLLEASRCPGFASDARDALRRTQTDN